MSLFEPWSVAAAIRQRTYLWHHIPREKSGFSDVRDWKAPNLLNEIVGGVWPSLVLYNKKGYGGLFFPVQESENVNIYIKEIAFSYKSATFLVWICKKFLNEHSELVLYWYGLLLYEITDFFFLYFLF